MGGAATRRLDPVVEENNEVLRRGSKSSQIFVGMEMERADDVINNHSDYPQPDVDVFFREMLVTRRHSKSEDHSQSLGAVTINNRKRSFTDNNLSMNINKSSKSDMPPQLIIPEGYLRLSEQNSQNDSLSEQSANSPSSPSAKISAGMSNLYITQPTHEHSVNPSSNRLFSMTSAHPSTTGIVSKPSSIHPGYDPYATPPIKVPYPPSIKPNPPAIMSPPQRQLPDDARKGVPSSSARSIQHRGGSSSSPSPTHAATTGAVRSTPLSPIYSATVPRITPPGTRPVSSKPNKQKGVIETSEVKRNTIQVPSKTTHATPTRGSWLNQRYIVNNYILLDTLGTGSYGQVRLCKDRTTDELYAMKIVSRDMLKKKKNGHSTETFLADIQREIAIMKKLSHPNVLRLFEVLNDPKVNKLYLVLEYMARGDLINELKSRQSKSSSDSKESTPFIPLSDRQLWNIFRQVTSGVIYLHYQNIVHGDIKPQNILVGEDGVVKIADFGISKMLDTSGDKVSDAAGTPAFMSPELCGGEAYDGQLADVWAIGATMYMLKFGSPPFLANTVISLYYKIQHDPLVFPFAINPNLKDLLEKMLTKNPANRYTLNQVSSHIWLLQPPLYSTSEQTAINGNTEDEARRKKNMFHPPVSYSKAHEAAMSNPVKDVSNNELSMSIGLGGTKDGTIVEDGKTDCDNECDEEMMQTRDVFEIVDDAEYKDDDSDDGNSSSRKSSRDSEECSGTKVEMDMKPSLRRSSVCSMSSQHEEMTEAEQLSRGKKFKTKLLRKSFAQEVELSSAVANVHSVFSSMADKKKSMQSLTAVQNDKSTPSSFKPAASNGNDSDDEAQPLSMDDVNSMLDTMGMQPNLCTSDSTVEISSYSLNMSQVSAEIQNVNNGVSIAHYSEQGARHSQEDRSVFIAEITPMDLLFSNSRQSFDEDFTRVSIACIFDGHSGSLTADLLVEKFCKTLLRNDMFRKKSWKDALIDTFRKVDYEICESLSEADDRSGSTGVVVIYDGRKNVLTVANVGDSRCILSRGGRAVTLHRLHRLSERDETERVIAAGGSIIKNRVNGVLAISRAFGDIEFKSSNPLHGLVVAVPDIHVERITPMTEFIVLATDGLFDVMEPQVVVNFVREKLHASCSLQESVKLLTKEAVARGSIDNVTAVIVSFNISKLR